MKLDIKRASAATLKVVATHEMKFALEVSDRVIFLERGKGRFRGIAQCAAS
jgi:ABC-type polar amino acid transport system ATPase subunit